MNVKFLVIVSFLAISAQGQRPLPFNDSLPWPYLKSLPEKFVIVDLFTSSCKSCFASLPKMNDLQKKYSGRVSIVMLGCEDGKIRQLYDKFKRQFNLSLDVQYDSGFFRTYEIESVPRCLWIDNKGIVRAITTAKDVIPSNVDLFLEGKFTVDPQSEKPFVFDLRKPFLLNGNGGNDTSAQFRSVFTRWRPRMPRLRPSTLNFVPGTGLFQTLGITRDQLYLYAYFGRCTWDAKDSLHGEVFPRVILFENGSYAKDTNSYCYSFLMPREKANKVVLQRSLRNDLYSYFGYEALLAKMKVPYWSVVIPPGNRERLRTRGGPMQHRCGYAGITGKNIPIARLIEDLETVRDDEMQYIDDSGWSENIDIDIATSTLEGQTLRHALEKAGFAILRAEREMTVILLRQPIWTRAH